jgi:hypothetical protein
MSLSSMFVAAHVLGSYVMCTREFTRLFRDMLQAAPIITGTASACACRRPAQFFYRKAIIFVVLLVAAVGASAVSVAVLVLLS